MESFIKLDTLDIASKICILEYIARKNFEDTKQSDIKEESTTENSNPMQ